MENSELKWLVDNRAKLPQILLKLRQRWDNAPTRPGGGAQSLVGVAFTLWRALPLMPENAIVPSKSAEHAKLLLEEIMVHNRINYPEERRFSHWTIGFYLNVAEARLCTVAELWEISDPAITFVNRCVTEPPFRHEQSYRIRWEHDLAALDTLVESLTASNGP